MWFRRDKKNRNRRIGRGNVLNVKLRSDQVRAARIRLGTLICCIAFGTFFGLYLTWRVGEVLLNKFVYENPDFAIQKVDIQTDGVIAVEQLRRWSNVRFGANLIGLDLANVKRNLEMESTVESASVERVLPHTLRIRVNERTPLAQVNLPCTDDAGNLAIAITQLDKNAVAMRPRDPRQCVVPLAQLNPQLPVITGLNPVRLKLGEAVPAPEVDRVQSALELIAAFSHSPMAGLVDLRTVDISAPGVLVVGTAQGGQITFGVQNFEQQLARWRSIYDYGRQANKGDIASVDLAVANNLPVHWLTVSNAVPVTAPKAKLQKRRNNV